MPERRHRVAEGEVYSRLTVHEAVKRPVLTTFYRCICECGKGIFVKPSDLRKGLVRSCGCLNKDTQRARMRKMNAKHGNASRHATSPEYRIWTGVKSRCSYEGNTVFKYYGGRGITVCDKWKDSFEAFMRDMGPRPSRKHSIERKDPNGNYEAGNCYWATRDTQMRNKRNNVVFTINNETMCLKDWATRYGVNYKSLHHQVHKRGGSIEAALQAARKEVKNVGQFSHLQQRSA